MELRMKAPIQNYISKVLMLFEEGYIRYQSLLTGFCPLKSLQGTIFIAQFIGIVSLMGLLMFTYYNMLDNFIFTYREYLLNVDFYTLAW